MAARVELLADRQSRLDCSSPESEADSGEKWREKGQGHGELRLSCSEAVGSRRKRTAGSLSDRDPGFDHTILVISVPIGHHTSNQSGRRSNRGSQTTTDRSSDLGLRLLQTVGPRSQTTGTDRRTCERKPCDARPRAGGRHCTTMTVSVKCSRDSDSEPRRRSPKLRLGIRD
eukprot:2944571-Rhodomonas_salina.3